MPSSNWWLSALNPKGLSQGDIVRDVPVGSAHFPLTYLGRDTWPSKGKTFWPQTVDLEKFKSDDTGLYISRGKMASAVVVSHSCELDDKPDVSRVLVAPVAALSQVPDADMRARILERRRRAFVPLPELPEIGDYYADLRCITYVDRRLITDSNRVVSMTAEGVVVLQAQLIAFLSRLDPDRVSDALAAGAATQNRQG